MIERHTSAALLNTILNDPRVRPDIAEATEGPIDCSVAVGDPSNILLMGEYGGCFFGKVMPGVYEVHTQALPEGRGKWIANFVREAGDWMFTRSDAFEIITRIPEAHIGARQLALHAWMRPEFTRVQETRWRGKLQDCDIYSFRIQDWASESATFDTSGELFHDFLHDEAKRLGVTQAAHEKDANHNRYVGICLEMVNHGQVAKAVNFYNRWAIISRHPIIKLVSENPITVAFDIGNLVFENGAMRVELADMAA